MEAEVGISDRFFSVSSPLVPHSPDQYKPPVPQNLEPALGSTSAQYAQRSIRCPSSVPGTP
eukprot:2313153-Rhodomonas_salina.1